MCGSIFGRSSAKKAAKAQAEATLKAASDQAAADRLAAKAAQAGVETQIAQRQAIEMAREGLDRPLEQAEVDLASGDEAEIDPATGRRRPARAAFMSERAAGSGIKIP